MRPLVAPAFGLGLLLLLAACEDPPSGRSAWSVDVIPSRLSDPVVDVMQSAPPQFALGATLSMPSPGYTLSVAEVKAPDAAGRITVTVDVAAREGIWPAVVTPMPIRIHLGSLEVGDYLVEVLERQEGFGVRPVGALLLRARGH